MVRQHVVQELVGKILAKSPAPVAVVTLPAGRLTREEFDEVFGIIRRQGIEFEVSTNGEPYSDMLFTNLGPKPQGMEAPSNNSSTTMKRAATKKNGAAKKKTATQKMVVKKKVVKKTATKSTMRAPKKRRK